MLLRHMNHRQSLPLLKALLHDPNSVDHDPSSQPFEGFAFHRTLYFVPRRTWFPIRDLEYTKFDPLFPQGLPPKSVQHLVKSFGDSLGLENYDVDVRRPDDDVVRLLEKIGTKPTVDLKYRDLSWAMAKMPNLPSSGLDSSVVIVRMGQDVREKVNDYPDYYFIRYLVFPYDVGGFCDKPIYGTPGNPEIPDKFDPDVKWVWDVIEYWPDSQRRYYTAIHMEPAGIGCLVNIRTGRRDYNSSSGDVKTLIGQLVEPSRNKHFDRPTFGDVLKGTGGGSARTEKYGRFKVTPEERLLITNDERWTREHIKALREDPFYKPDWMIRDEENHAAEVARLAEEGRLAREAEAAAAERRKIAEEKAKNRPDDEWPSTEIE